MASCLTPITLKVGTHVPCGKCANCKARRVSGWSFRLRQEDLHATTSHFVTLTYDEKAIKDRSDPLCERVSKHGYYQLCKRDVQLFFKRLREAHGTPNNIRYYAVGEYGSETHRPHYHAIIFNAVGDLIDAAWGLGHTFIGTVSGASIGYCLKYLSKEDPRKGKYWDDRTAQFALMSKGLGKSYLTDEIIDYHTSDLKGKLFCTVPGGQKLSMPRYYKDKIYHPAERRMISGWYKDNMIPLDIPATSIEFTNNLMRIDAIKGDKL